MSNLYIYGSNTFLYEGKIEPNNQRGDEVYVTHVKPPYDDFRFNIKWYPHENLWSYVEKPQITDKYNPGIMSEYDVMLTYKHIREFQYPSQTEYLDGIIKGDEEQVSRYIQQCKDVKIKWPKDTPDMTMRDYWIKIGKIRED